MKATTFGQLAMSYNPSMEYHAAVCTLRQWISKVPRLEARMQRAGFRRGASLMTPRVVQMVTAALGEP